MECKICGEKLKKEGDICNSCLSEIKENEKLKKDTKVKYEIKQEFKLASMICRKIDLFIALVIVYIATIFVIEKWYIAVIISVVVLGFVTIEMIVKRIWSQKSYCKFYKYKLKMRSYPFKEVTIKYSDLKDISYIQDIVQGIFKIGDLRISYNTGNSLINSIKMFNNIKNPKDVMEELQKIVKK